LYRLIKYGIPVDRVGAYFGERKEIREITISTYQSAISDLDLHLDGLGELSHFERLYYYRPMSKPEVKAVHALETCLLFLSYPTCFFAFLMMVSSISISRLLPATALPLILR
jgi:hypothetical protein